MNKLFKVILLIIFLCPIKSNAQLPEIFGNTSEYQKKNSTAYRMLKDNYDFIISFGTSGGWKIGDTSTLQILAKRDKSWSRIDLKFSEHNLLEIPKLEISSIKRTKAEILIKELSALGFWSLRNDSLNIKEIKPKIAPENFVDKDTIFIVADRIRRFKLLDGIIYYFQIIQNNELRIYSCESPDSYLRAFPEIKTTAAFIKAIAFFESAIK